MSGVSEDQVYDKGSVVPKTLYDGKLDGWILNQEDIDKMESVFALYRASDLEEKTAGLGFGIEKLKAIHKHLFQDIYSWAGEVRAFDAYKSSNEKHPFADPSEFNDIFKGIELQILELEWFDPANKIDRDKFVGDLSDIYAQVNDAHIFPDGNGRVSREYISMLAEDAGFFLDHSEVNKKDWHKASKASFEGDRSQLRSLFDKMVTENPLNLKHDNQANGNVDPKSLINNLNHLKLLGIGLEGPPPEFGTKNNKEHPIIANAKGEKKPPKHEAEGSHP